MIPTFAYALVSHLRNVKIPLPKANSLVLDFCQISRGVMPFAPKSFGARLLHMIPHHFKNERFSHAMTIDLLVARMSECIYVAVSSTGWKFIPMKMINCDPL